MIMYFVGVRPRLGRSNTLRYVVSDLPSSHSHYMYQRCRDSLRPPNGVHGTGSFMHVFRQICSHLAYTTGIMSIVCFSFPEVLSFGAELSFPTPLLINRNQALVRDDEKLLISKALRDMSSFVPGHPQMMKEDVLPALVRLAKVENAEIKQDVAAALCRLSASVELAFDMVDEGLPEALYWLTLEDLLALNKSVLLRCSVVCRNAVLCDDALRRISSESSRFSKVLERLSCVGDPDLLLNVAMVCLRITGMRDSMLAFHRGILWPTG